METGQLEILARGICVAALLMIITRSLITFGSIPAGRWLATLGIALIAYSVAPLIYKIQLLGPMVLFTAGLVPPVFWFFCRALFEDQKGSGVWVNTTVLFVIVYIIVIVARLFLLEEQISWGLPAVIFYLSYSIQLIFIGLSLYSLVRSRSDDLVHSRRTLRRFILFGSASYITLVLLAELWLGIEQASELVRILHSSGLALFFLSLATWFLILAPDDLIATEQSAHWQSKSSPSDDLSHTEKQWLEKLNNLMLMDKAYRRSDLTIKKLALELKIPEHLLRKLINHQLGYRNFRRYLNGFRLEEATTRLRSLEDERTPILTIALDAGFASITPFNRAFRDCYGQSPSEYRHQNSAITP